MVFQLVYHTTLVNLVKYDKLWEAISNRHLWHQIKLIPLVEKIDKGSVWSNGSENLSINLRIKYARVSASDLSNFADTIFSTLVVEKKLTYPVNNIHFRTIVFWWYRLFSWYQFQQNNSKTVHVTLFSQLLICIVPVHGENLSSRS